MKLYHSLHNIAAFLVWYLAADIAGVVNGYRNDSKRAPLSINQPLAILSEMMGHGYSRENPLLALGKRDPGAWMEEKRAAKRAPLSINQPLTVLSDMYGAGNNERNPLLALGKRGKDSGAETDQIVNKRMPLSMNQALHVLRDYYGTDTGESNPLMALGKRSGNSGEELQVRQTSPKHWYWKRAPLSVNQPLEVLSGMYGARGGLDRGRNPLLALGKRTTRLSINTPLSILSEMISAKYRERRMRKGLGKRPSPEVHSAVRVPMSRMYTGIMPSRANSLIYLGKRTASADSDSRSDIADYDIYQI